jgi:hypothetical protein
MKAWTAVSQGEADLEQGRAIPMNMVEAESTAASSRILEDTGVTGPSVVLAVADRAASDAGSAKGEDACSMPAM